VDTPNFVLYGLNRLGPYLINQHLEPVKASGYTTIVIGMLHIGNPAVKDTTQLGDIIFNGDEPLVIRDREQPFPLVTGQHRADCLAWPGRIAALKGQSSSVTQVFASVGGGGWDYVNRRPLVRDYETIQSIYKANGNTFENSVLERNFTAFRKAFPAIDGIDLDCEETYDHDSFVAFCEMLIKIGFALTFCPYEQQEQSFWVNALVALEKRHLMRYVKWWNLQCYDGGRNNEPDRWATAIGAAFKQPPVRDYIVAGDWAKFWNNDHWDGNCPAFLTQKFSGFSRDCLAGGFIWVMDQIISAEERAHDPDYKDPCPSETTPRNLAGYLGAMKKGLGV
jgi:hypothetical protein